MKQPVSFWLEHFAIQHLCSTMPELRGQPVALFNGRQRIIQVNTQARAGGIVPGMRCREATARVAQLALLPLASVTETRQTLRQLAGDLLAFSPTVATWGDEEIVVDLAPSQHLYGGLDPLLAHLTASLDDAGWRWRAAVASSLSGARLGARLLANPQEVRSLSPRQEGRFLRELTLAQLTALPDFLHADREQRLFGFLGIHTLGDLAAVPPHALRETLRPAELELLDYARRSPQLTRHLEPIRHHPGLTIELSFSPPLVDQAPLLAQLDVSYHELQERLFRRRLLLARLDLVLVLEDLSERHLSMPLSRPTREPRLLLDVTRLKLADVQLIRPLIECRLEAAELARETIRSRDLLAWHRQNNHTTLDELRSRLDARLNRRDTLFTLVPRPVPLPEQGYLPAHSPLAAQAPLDAPPALLPEADERGRDLPLLIVTDAVPLRLPEPLTQGRTPDFLFQLYDPTTVAIQRTEYHRVVWQGRPVLARVRDRNPGEVVGLDD